MKADGHPGGQWPDFFSAIPEIHLRDPLAQFLGANPDGVLHYCFADAVRLCGHSCPTVAGAYGLARRALQNLYGNDLPVRGDIRVEFATAQDDGTTGVIASVLGLLTGSAGEGGFKGLGGRFARRDLLSFARPLPLDMRLTRLDNGQAVDAAFNPASVPAPAELSSLMLSCLLGKADSTQQSRFCTLWQSRVHKLLIEHADDPAVFVVHAVN